MLTDTECWNLIKKAKWESDHNYDRINLFFHKELNAIKFKQLQTFVSNKCEELGSRFNDDWLGTPGIEVSDDGWWDLRAEVVGRGKEFFDAITTEKLKEMASKHDYHENFEYSLQD